MRNISFLICVVALSSGCTTVYLRIDSDPQGASIFWGPSEPSLGDSCYKTPYSYANTNVYPGYKDWYYQLKKHGYNDSEIIFREECWCVDRNIFVRLQPNFRPAPPKAVLEPEVKKTPHEPSRSGCHSLTNAESCGTLRGKRI